jgi:hypothetical protein
VGILLFVFGCKKEKGHPSNTTPPPFAARRLSSQPVRQRLQSRILSCSASWTASPRASAVAALTFRRDPTPQAGARRRQEEARRSGRSKSVRLCSVLAFVVQIATSRYFAYPPTPPPPPRPPPSGEDFGASGRGSDPYFALLRSASFGRRFEQILRWTISRILRKLIF